MSTNRSELILTATSDPRENVTATVLHHEDSRDDHYKAFFKQLAPGVVLTIILLEGFILAANVITGYAMWRTTRCAHPVKHVSWWCLLFHAAYTVFIIMACIGYFVGSPGQLVVAIVTQFGRYIIATNSCLVSLLLLDRTLCFYKPYEYNRRITTRVFSVIVGVTICSVILVKTSIRFVVIPLLERRTPSLEDFLSDKQIQMYLNMITLIVNMFCFAALLYLSWYHRRRVRDQMQVGRTHIRQFSSSAGVIIVTSFYTLFNAFVLLLYVGYHKGVLAESRSLVFLGYQSTCLVEPLLYVVIFRECRYIVFRMVFQRFQRCQRRVEIMRIRVYNIVINN